MNPSRPCCSSHLAHHASLVEGIDLFNACQFWQAHEAWERIWLTAKGEEKIFLQGLIQVAAAYHHVRRGTFSGAIRLFDIAMAKLSRFPDGYLHVDRTQVTAVAATHRGRIAGGQHIDEKDFPKIRYN